jgi:membrane-bound serine protease (ClpP class)
VGTATLVGSAALVLLVLVSATADMANGFPWLLVALGAVLLGIEVFVLPGFGVAGVFGLIAMATGFLFLMTGVSLSDAGTLSFATARDFLVQMLLAMGVAGVAFLVLARLFPSLPGANRHLILSGTGRPSGAATLPGDLAPVAGEVAGGDRPPTVRPRRVRRGRRRRRQRGRLDRGRDVGARRARRGRARHRARRASGTAGPAGPATS